MVTTTTTSTTTMLDEPVENGYQKAHVIYDYTIFLCNWSDRASIAIVLRHVYIFHVEKWFYSFALAKNYLTIFVVQFVRNRYRENYVKPNEIDTQTKREKEKSER